MAGQSARRVLLVGWDAADWKVIHPLLDEGRMPVLESLVNGGVMGNITTLHPVLSPMLWTSIATGKRPFKHGILGFTEPNPSGDGIRPITNLGRQCKAIWNILGQQGLTSNVIGWWPSHPAEPINGVMVSNEFHSTATRAGESWPLPPGSVHPPSLANELAEFRIHPQELAAEHILPFIPRASEIDQQRDARLAVLARVLCDCTSVHAVATHLMDTQRWDFTAVYYDAIDHFSHAFMKYHPPRRQHIAEEDFDRFSGVLARAYEYHDMMLGALLSRIDDETTVIVLSDHGFHPDHLRPVAIPHEPAGPALEHRDIGIFVAKGPGVRQDAIIHGASLLDITPTILGLFGLPIGEDMDGRPLTELFAKAPTVGSVASWEDILGDDGRHPAGVELAPTRGNDSLKQLVELGYVESPEGDGQQVATATKIELQFNLARSYMDAGQFANALQILLELYSNQPTEFRFGIQLVLCCRALGQVDQLKQMVAGLIVGRERLAAIAQEKLGHFDELVDRRRRRLAQQTGENGSVPLLLPNERRERGRLSALADVGLHSMEYLKGYACLAEGDAEGALEHLQRAADGKQDRPDLQVQIGKAFFKLEKWDDAERAFQNAIATDPESAQAFLGLSRCALAKGQDHEAATKATQAIGLMYHFPLAHYCLGTALERLGQSNRAIEALQTATSQRANFVEAHELLAKLLLGDQADKHQQRANEIREEQSANPVAAMPDLDFDQIENAWNQAISTEEARPAYVEPDPVLGLPPLFHRSDAELEGDVITVVSGLPRSGTSMMMQMLAAGGIEPYCDSHRAPDANNSLGYFELELVKNLPRDRSWLSKAQGKAIKVIAQLIPFLDARYRYRVLFMNRNIDEIMASQMTMLKRLGKDECKASAEQLRTQFETELDVVRGMLHRHIIPLLEVNYVDAIAEPSRVASEVNQFVGGTLDMKLMAAAVNSDLYRERLPVSR